MERISQRLNYIFHMSVGLSRCVMIRSAVYTCIAKAIYSALHAFFSTPTHIYTMRTLYSLFTYTSNFIYTLLSMEIVRKITCDILIHQHEIK